MESKSKVKLFYEDNKAVRKVINTMRLHTYIVSFITLIMFSHEPVLAQEDAFKKDRQQAFYNYHESQCLEKGWRKIIVNIDGQERKILWNCPKGRWENGAIIVLHGGGGSYSNFCSNIRIGGPMIEFSDLAIKEGFAVFSLDSENDLMKDEKGNPCGKRWDCLEHDYPNADLAFIETVITKTIPQLRPSDSARGIFIAGISNGGFMTILAATHFEDKISAFAAVSAGDPYGTYMDCADKSTGREGAPGRWYDNETHTEIGETDACTAAVYPHEKEWKQSITAGGPIFKQFHHEGDKGVDISCMKKAQSFLNMHGYADAGSYIVKDQGPKRSIKHFWRSEYNRPLIDFFKNSAAGYSRQWHTTPDQWEEPRIYHSQFDEDYANRIDISHVNPDNLPKENSKEKVLSSNKAYWYIVRLPDTKKPGPWSAEILIFNERDYLIKINLADYAATYTVTTNWINEKLLYVQLWWGRILGTCFIFDVEKEKIVTKEMVHYGGIAFEQWQEGRNLGSVKSSMQE